MSLTTVNSHLSITKLPCCRRHLQMSLGTYSIALFFLVTVAGSTSGQILPRPMSAIPIVRCTVPLVGLDGRSAMLYSVGTRSALPCPSSMISLMVKYFSFMCRFLGVIRHSLALLVAVPSLLAPAAQARVRAVTMGTIARYVGSVALAHHEMLGTSHWVEF